ncbi:diguanylate cyclase [Microvirga tunisiensis]|uniref:diguanylate cyclase n=2 Tax=Pannonibacter tanglangensis TaxID=2750084 RepID=A0A7X5F333_9HYPH|nr:MULTISPECIES: GGDEF domain-containing protein [unclassified Pannonibacter]NBN62238.1 diguanylate cyclase [Pannonibacter sp. XCT-34]NBN77905.1 diguanylate cyclase [Pannonibacter sp. XCT-53]
MSDQEDFKRTITYGESALSYIRRNTLPAYPRNYELWYTYSAGFNHGLNRAINDIITVKGGINGDDLQKIYAKFLSPNRLGDRIDEVGAKVAEEVQDLVDAIRVSTDATADYGEALETASEKLKDLADPEKLRAVVAHMIKSTHAAVAANRNLESQLLESRRQIETLQENLEAIRYESLTDDLTTLNNRRHFDMMIEKAIRSAADSGEPFALLLTDIDHFKKFNDTYGHQTGDQVLRLVALAVKQNVKGQDCACRYGGEEFAIILPNTGIAAASEIAESIRKAVYSKELVKRSTGENLGRITMSIGVSEYRSGDTSQTVIARADLALYAAKHEGRNRVKCESDTGVVDDTRVA